MDEHRAVAPPDVRCDLDTLNVASPNTTLSFDVCPPPEATVVKPLLMVLVPMDIYREAREV